MIHIYTITTAERHELIKRFVLSLKESYDNTRVLLTVVENGTDELYDDICRWFGRDIDYISSDEHFGLAEEWNLCMSDSVHENILLCNDDVVFAGGWIDKLEEVMSLEKGKIYLLSKPNGFSGFLITKTLWEKYGMFNDNFTSGYYEDDDFYLRVCETIGITRKEAAMEKAFYSFADKHGYGLLTHLPYTGNKKLTTWNRDENFKVFSKDWEQVAPYTDGAIENKNLLWYKRRN